MYMLPDVIATHGNHLGSECSKMEIMSRECDLSCSDDDPNLSSV